MTELKVLGACHHDCPDTCAWEVTVVDGVATKLKGNAEHPITRGTLCPKVNRFLDRVYHPDRLLTPLRRSGPKGSGAYEPISWDDAIAEIAAQIRTRIDAGRCESIAQFSFAGTQGLVQMGVMLDHFFDVIGASDIHRELCGVTSWQGSADVLGRPFGIDPESMYQAKTIVLWGTNTRITNRHLWPTIEQARADGAQIIVVDPVRTDTAREADTFIQLRPGTDVALVLGLLHVIDRDGLTDPSWIEARTTGWDELRTSAAHWTPQRASEACGVPAEQIEWLAHRMATARPTAVRVLVGPEHREVGRDILRAVTMLPAVLGLFNELGGGLARSVQGWQFTALNMPLREHKRPAFNMARLGEVLLAPKPSDPNIDMLVVHNSNPASVLPDQNRVIEGLQREDLFTVVIEYFMTDTAQYADIILPSTTQIEHLDLSYSWGHFYLALNQPAISPAGDSLPNSEIARRLAAALGVDDDVLRMTDEEVIRDLLASDHPFLEGITYEGLASQGWARLNVSRDSRPHVDDIPDVPTRAMRLRSLEFRAGSETRAGNPALAKRFPLELISRKQNPKFLNANYGGFPKHYASSGHPSLELDVADAQARGISKGDWVRVHNDRGSLTLVAEISDDLQPGLASMPFGYWNRNSPEGRAVNALTNPSLPDDDRGSAFFHETLVQVTRVTDSPNISG
jgi:anaerobic selenocysteine-containing dehydrogenase